MNEITIRVNITADSLVSAVNNLANAISKSSNIETGLPVDVSESVENLKQEAVVEESPKFTIENVRTAFAIYAKAKGKDKAKEVLAQFGSTKVTELKESDYNAVMKVLEV